MSILGRRRLEELVIDGPLSFRVSDMVNMDDRLNFLTVRSDLAEYLALDLNFLTVPTLVLKGFAVQPREFFHEVEEGKTTTHSNPAPQAEEL